MHNKILALSLHACTVSAPLEIGIVELLQFSESRPHQENPENIPLNQEFDEFLSKKSGSQMEPSSKPHKSSFTVHFPSLYINSPKPPSPISHILNPTTSQPLTSFSKASCSPLKQTISMWSLQHTTFTSRSCYSFPSRPVIPSWINSSLLIRSTYHSFLDRPVIPSSVDQSFSHPLDPSFLQIER